MPNPKQEPLNLFSIFTNPLNQNQIEYMVTGSVAAMVYGEPRLTHDIDLILSIKEADILKFENIFPPEKFYCPPPEVIKIENQRPLRGHFNLIHHDSGFKADVYTLGKDPLHQWAFPKKQKIEFNQNDLWLAPPEYVILKKLLFFKEGKSEKHLNDIKSIIKNFESKINVTELEQKIEENHLEEFWHKAKEIT